MNKIFQKLDKKISDKKAAKEKEEKKKGRLWEKYYDFESQNFKKHLHEDFKKLEKLFIKHVHKLDHIKVKLSTNTFELEVESRVSLPDDIYSDAIEIKMINRKSLSYEAKEEHLKAYTFSESNFAIKVSSLGELEASVVDVTRPTVESKEFELKDKDSAYEYMNNLFQEKMLGLREKEK